MWKAAVGRGDNPDSIVDTGVPRSLAPKAASASGFDFTASSFSTIFAPGKSSPAA